MPLVSYVGQFINILKKSIIYVFHPIYIFKTLKVALELACFQTTEHANNVYT